MKKLQRKRWFALVLIVLVLLLFYRSEWLGRMMYPIAYREEIEQASANAGVDPFLVAAVIRVESNFRPDRESRKGAIGIMQIMPETAEWMLERDKDKDSKLTRLHDPQVNINLGTAYLGLLHQQFQYDQVKAIASYNAGPGNVNKWLSGDIWDGRLETSDSIPFGETRKYVSKVMYYYRKYVELYAS